MKLIPPFDVTTISQRFGQNANVSYGQDGLLGHTGIDFAVPYGTPIPASVDAYCYSIMNKDNFDLMKYRGVFTIVDDTDASYEVSYGHCSQISALAGSVYDKGDTVALIGNTGVVYVGDHLVTGAEKNSGSVAGSHLHFQVRKLKRVVVADTPNPVGPYLSDANGLIQRNGYYYQIPDYHNGYNGCIDPSQFFPLYRFNNDLHLGMANNEVYELQKRLGVDYSSGKGIFGPRTFLAVRAYQKANGISTTGYVGPLTRVSLNATI